MGQKVNPTSMRLQLNKDWRSRWFAEKKDYKRFLIEDITVRKLIDDKYGFRGSINRVDIERAPNLVTVTVHTAKAGVVIGRGGSGAQELKAAVEKILKVPVRLNIEEVKKPEMFAKLVAENIAHQLQRHISFRRAMKMSAQNTMRAGAKGIRVELAGRLNNSEMARREKEILGSVPLHTLRAEIDYALAVANTPAGTIGVKVWIHKGEAK